MLEARSRELTVAVNQLAEHKAASCELEDSIVRMRGARTGREVELIAQASEFQSQVRAPHHTASQTSAWHVSHAAGRRSQVSHVQRQLEEVEGRNRDLVGMWSETGAVLHSVIHERDEQIAFLGAHLHERYAPCGTDTPARRESSHCIRPQRACTTGEKDAQRTSTH